MPDCARKADAEAIRNHLKQLESASFVPAPWWPRFVYHFAELKNAVSILECGRLYSRSAAKQKIDTASADVIGHTDPKWTQYVRFYFRPRTPTQFRSEGFKPVGNYGPLNAHCPMPFVFLFDAADILTRSDTLFTDGNIGANPAVGADAEFIRRLPFDKIYHSASLGELEKRTIIHHRCAEVLHPVCVELTALTRVWCRSPAEYETLLNNLSTAARARYEARIGHGAQLETHFRKWTYIESVTMEQKRVTIRFNPSSQTPGPFKALISITSPKYGVLEWTDEAFTAPSTHAFILNIRQHEEDIEYDIVVTLDEHEAYRGHYRPKPSSTAAILW